MASFAERIGKRAPRTLIQIEELGTETRTALWNDLVPVKDVLENFHYKYHGTDRTEAAILHAIWTRDFKRAADEMPYHHQVWKLIKEQILTSEWFLVLDLLESIVKYLRSYESDRLQGAHTAVIEKINSTFEYELVGYRFIGNEITPITEQTDVEAVSEALEQSQNFPGARHHLEQAISLLADKQNPDYPNSIKESISAVEAVVRTFSEGKTLGQGLKKLEESGLTIHPSLKGAWSQLYGWTSDDNGIRHGGIEAAKAGQPLAKYMLISCSAFVAYLIEEANKKGLLP